MVAQVKNVFVGVVVMIPAAAHASQIAMDQEEFDYYKLEERMTKKFTKLGFTHLRTFEKGTVVRVPRYTKVAEYLPAKYENFAYAMSRGHKKDPSQSYWKEKQVLIPRGMVEKINKRVNGAAWFKHQGFRSGRGWSDMSFHPLKRDQGLVHSAASSEESLMAHNMGCLICETYAEMQEMQKHIDDQLKKQLQQAQQACDFPKQKELLRSLLKAQKELRLQLQERLWRLKITEYESANGYLENEKEKIDRLNALKKYDLNKLMDEYDELDCEEF